MKYVPVNDANRKQIKRLLIDQWYTTDMIIRGVSVDMTKAGGIAAYEKESIVGLVLYAITDSICHLISLNSLIRHKGIATELISRVADIARGGHCTKIVAVTTNDNIDAIRFYQKRGFDMAYLYHDALAVSRKMKPQIPLMAENGIPMRHEIQFELDLRDA